mgnify:CR=1 FL=1
MRRLSLIILSFCMLLLSGCATIDSDVKIDSDGSGTWNAQVKSQAGPFPKETITEILTENNVQNYTINALDDQGKVVTVEDGDNTPYNIWTVKTKFNDVETLNKVRDAMTLRNKNQGPLLALEKTTSGSYIVDLGTSQGKTTVTVSGEIDPVSVQTGTLTDKNTVTFTQNSHIRFIFKPSHGWLFYIGIGVAIVAVIGGGYIFYLRRKYYGDAA